MGSQKVVNNPLGSYPVAVDRDSMGVTRQAVGIDIGDVVGDVWTPSRVTSSNPFPVSNSANKSGGATAGDFTAIGAYDAFNETWYPWPADTDSQIPLVKTARDGAPITAPTFATVGTSSAQVLPANSNRSGLIIVNTSATATVSLGIGSTAVLYSGITLFPQGAFNMGEFDFSKEAITAIASAAGTNISIQEFE